MTNDTQRDSGMPLPSQPNRLAVECVDGAGNPTAHAWVVFEPGVRPPLSGQNMHAGARITVSAEIVDVTTYSLPAQHMLLLKLTRCCLTLDGVGGPEPNGGAPAVEPGQS